ncbi:PREDICTED: uncharacterized protein LOC106808260 isoform X3 [Priapulus caudatus]|uniref:Uncharacterized protein LOC106808260 isoform X3 n=1 Tax=Priapulus caudatus TaxID=37621 RepID=A0ABM1E2G1_PRICU|nr:PREDICTED: uncharacterized protein LOC106808260 isoform X3 [Priapulus caudatus]
MQADATASTTTGASQEKTLASGKTRDAIARKTATDGTLVASGNDRDAIARETTIDSASVASGKNRDAITQVAAAVSGVFTAAASDVCYSDIETVARGCDTDSGSYPRSPRVTVRVSDGRRRTRRQPTTFVSSADSCGDADVVVTCRESDLSCGAVFRRDATDGATSDDDVRAMTSVEVEEGITDITTATVAATTIVAATTTTTAATTATITIAAAERESGNKAGCDVSRNNSGFADCTSSTETNDPTDSHERTRERTRTDHTEHMREPTTKTDLMEHTSDPARTFAREHAQEPDRMTRRRCSNSDHGRTQHPAEDASDLATIRENPDPTLPADGETAECDLATIREYPDPTLSADGATSTELIAIDVGKLTAEEESHRNHALCIRAIATWLRTIGNEIDSMGVTSPASPQYGVPNWWDKHGKGMR